MVDGIGKTLLTKLEAIGITKKSQLVIALSDSANTRRCKASSAPSSKKSLPSFFP